MRISKVTTKTGDQGSTCLATGERVSKHDLIMDVLGGLDELNAWIGHIRSQNTDSALDESCARIQQDLFDLGGEISLQGKKSLLPPGRLEALESEIQEWNGTLPPLQEFVVPGGSELVSRIHIARTVCRRVERSLAGMDVDKTAGTQWLPYLNRLSDWLFVLARFCAHQDNRAEEQWQRDSR